MERAIEKMQAANQAKDYKAFYRAQAEFYAALRLSDEADEYYQRHLADLPPLSGQDKGELERTNT
jgi:predicted RNA polymerase sigma factor